MNKRFTQERFIQESNLKHNYKYDYSESICTGSRDKIKIICPSHGPFYQRADNHMQIGRGCPECAKILISRKLVSDKDTFIEKSKSVHRDKYDYSLVSYRNSRTKVNILCTSHGVFQQSPHAHIQGDGCPACGKQIRKQKPITAIITDTNERFEGQIVPNFGIKINNSTVILKCIQHGEFETTVRKISSGLKHVCPKCSSRRYSSKISSYPKIYRPSSRAYIYVIRLYDWKEIFYKVGITRQNSIVKRFGGNKVNNYFIEIIRFHETTLAKALKEEKEILNGRYNIPYLPSRKFGGWTECLENNPLADVNLGFLF